MPSSMVGKTWAKHETMFPTIVVLPHQILGIIGSQIEIKRIFSSIGILTNLRRCHLQSKKFKRLIFVNKNRPNDPRIDS